MCNYRNRVDAAPRWSKYVANCVYPASRDNTYVCQRTFPGGIHAETDKGLFEPSRLATYTSPSKCAAAITLRKYQASASERPPESKNALDSVKLNCEKRYYFS